MAHRGERAFDDVRRAQMLPVLGREVVEGEQRVAILDQTLDRLVVFDAPGLDEGVEGRKRILLGFGHPDFLQRPLGFRLLALRQFVEDVGGFMHPAALAARLGPYLFERLPESKRAISEASSGPIESPRRFRSRSNSRQDCALSRTPSVRPTSSFLPSGVAPRMISRHCALSSRRACT